MPLKFLDFMTQPSDSTVLKYLFRLRIGREFFFFFFVINSLMIRDFWADLFA